jgi:hypothetical protein
MVQLCQVAARCVKSQLAERHSSYLALGGGTSRRSTRCAVCSLCRHAITKHRHCPMTHLRHPRSVALHPPRPCAPRTPTPSPPANPAPRPGGMTEGLAPRCEPSWLATGQRSVRSRPSCGRALGTRARSSHPRRRRVGALEARSQAYSPSPAVGEAENVHRPRARLAAAQPRAWCSPCDARRGGPRRGCSPTSQPCHQPTSSWTSREPLKDAAIRAQS